MESRVIAELRGPAHGPTLIIVGGMHGNEPAGVSVARSVLGGLRADGVRGEVLALIGNRRASQAGRRCLVADLNRMWTVEQVATARASVKRDTTAAVPGGTSPLAIPELHELVELAGAIDAAVARARGPVYLIDLHTTSAAGHPFAVVGPSESHRRFAEDFPLPGIIGLDKALPGVLTSYYGRLGCIPLAIEGGQHISASAAYHLSSVVTLALQISGCVPDMPGADAARQHLERARGELPPRIEVTVRHAIRPEDRFRMEPGFANLQRVAAGTLLAHDAAGEVRAPYDGVVVLPLYQPDGDDGFFFGRAVGG